MRLVSTKIEYFFQQLQLFALGVLCSTYIFRHAFFKDVDLDFVIILSNIRYVIYVFMLLSIVYNAYVNKTNIKIIAFMFITLGYTVVLSYQSEIVLMQDYQYLVLEIFTYTLLNFAYKDIEYNRIIKALCIAFLIAICTILIMYLLSLLRVFIEWRGDVFRYNLGMYTKNDLPYIVLYLYLYYFYLRKENISICELVLMFLINYLIYYYTNVRSVFALNMLMLICMFVLKYFNQIRDYKRVYGITLMLASVFAPISIVLLSFFYDDDIFLMNRLNAILSGRLSIGHEALGNLGIHLFGDYVEYTNYPYFVIDSSYLRFLLDYGVIAFFLLIIALLYFAYLIHKKRDIYLTIIMLASVLHMMFDIDLFYMTMNYLLFIWSYKNSNLNVKVR